MFNLTRSRLVIPRSKINFILVRGVWHDSPPIFIVSFPCNIQDTQYFLITSPCTNILAIYYYTIHFQDIDEALLSSSAAFLPPVYFCGFLFSFCHVFLQLAPLLSWTTSMNARQEKSNTYTGKETDLVYLLRGN